jgi:RNase P/RNase MRP subunit POP5
MQVLGSRLRGADREAWRQLIDDLDAGGKAADNITEEIRRTCKPSYTALPLPLKRCFVTFAAYPEDAQIEEDELVALWAAADPVHGAGTTRRARQRLRDLHARCLVQCRTSDRKKARHGHA